MTPEWRGQRSQIGGSLATMHWTDEPEQQKQLRLKVISSGREK